VIQIKKYLSTMMCLLSLLQFSCTARNESLRPEEISFLVNDAIIIEDWYPFAQAINNNPSDGIIGIRQKDIIKFNNNNGTIEEFSLRFRICGTIEDNFPYAIISPKEGIMYFRKDKGSKWESKKYSLNGRVSEQFPDCPNIE